MVITYKTLYNDPLPVSTWNALIAAEWNVETLARYGSPIKGEASKWFTTESDAYCEWRELTGRDPHRERFDLRSN